PRARLAHEVPGRVDEAVHGVGFAPGRPAALRTTALVERRAPGERIAAAIGHQVLGQHHRQLLVGHRHRAARAAVDDRNRAAPVALPGDAPVAQAVLHALAAET